MEQKKNFCAQVPTALHAQVCEARGGGPDQSKYITNLLVEYYNLKKNGSATTMRSNTRTTAFQISEQLFQRIKAHLKRETQRTGRKLPQRKFVLNLIKERKEFYNEQRKQNAPHDPGSCYCGRQNRQRHCRGSWCHHYSPLICGGANTAQCAITAAEPEPSPGCDAAQNSQKEGCGPHTFGYNGARQTAVTFPAAKPSWEFKRSLPQS